MSAMLTTLLLLSGLAHAHGAIGEQVSLRLEEGRARALLVLPVGLLEGVDDDGDGRLAVAEAQAHREEILAQVEQALWLEDEAGQRPARTFADVLIPGLLTPGFPGSADHVQLVLRYDWGRPAEGVALQSRLHPTQPLRLHAVDEARGVVRDGALGGGQETAWLRDPAPAPTRSSVGWAAAPLLLLAALSLWLAERGAAVRAGARAAIGGPSSLGG